MVERQEIFEICQFPFWPMMTILWCPKSRMAEPDGCGKWAQWIWQVVGTRLKTYTIYKII